jgi:hypothetical protein
MLKRSLFLSPLAGATLLVGLAASALADRRPPGPLDSFLPLLIHPATRTSVPLLPPSLRFLDGNPSDGIWSELDPPFRYGQGAIFDPVGNRMIVWGGYDNSEELWSFDLGARSWKKLQPLGEIPEGRGDVNMIYDPMGHRALFVDGERFDADGETRFGDVWELKLDEPITWSRLRPSGPSPPPRFEASLTYDPRRHRALLYGGHFSNVGPTDEIWELSLDNRPTWSRVHAAGMAPLARYGHVAVYDSRRDRLVVEGGVSYSEPDGWVWALSLGDSIPTWTLTAPLGPAPGQPEAAVAAYDSLNDRLLVQGGRSDSLGLWQLALDGTGGWSPVPVPGASPSNRFDASLVIDTITRDVLFYGGHVDVGSSCEVWRMPLQGPPSWDSLSPAGSPPPPLYKPVVVYDPPRDRLIVCGRSWLDPDSLALYVLPLGVPAHWQRLHPAGPEPLPRAAASAIYDPVGDRMVMFGGVFQSNSRPNAVLSDIWELSLGSDPTWKPILPREATTGCFGQGTAYDPIGQRMIVFGGYFASGQLTNRIAALSLRGEPVWSDVRASGRPPEPRVEPAMVYDARRDRLVVWSGNSTRQRLTDTWFFDLHASAWHDMTARDRPRARDSFSAVYDSLGDRMVLHGGFEVGDDWTFGSDTWVLPLSSYDWKELAPSGTTPPGREYHSAVYDSRRDRMLIFGGRTWFDASSEIWELSWNRPRHENPLAGIESGLDGSRTGRRGGLQLEVSNPSRGDPRIWFQLPASSPARLTALSVTGRALASLSLDPNDSARPGYRTLPLALPPGLYFLRLEQDGLSIHRKIVVY